MSEKETKKQTENTSTDTQQVYEISYLLVSSLSEDKVEEKVSSIKGAIAERGGELISEGAPKMQALAYTVEIPRTVPREKYDHAYFGWVKFELDVSKLEELHALLSVDKSIIRFLAIKTVREDTMIQDQKKETSKDGEKEEGDDIDSKDSSKKKDDLDKSIDELVVS